MKSLFEKWVIIPTFSLIGLSTAIAGDQTPENRPPLAVSAGNPAAVNENVGTGKVGELIGLTPDTGLRLGGMFLADINWLISGGKEPGKTSWNFLFVSGLEADLETIVDIPGAEVGAQFLLYKGADTNGQAGVVQGYNSLPALPPLNRAELYQLWWRQSLFDERLFVRVGKSVPTLDFTNVVAPIPTKNEPFHVSSISSLIYTPIFVNPTTVGVMPGYYDSAWGVTLNIIPHEDIYVNWGIYDGSLASGFTTGDHAFPQFNGTYFMAAEIGGDWHFSDERYLGRAAFGGWQQTGNLTGGGVTEDGAYGFYGYASQTVWYDQAENSPTGGGVIAFFQWGANVSQTLPMNGFLGAGATAFNLVPSRPNDTFGVGAAYSWLNPNSFQRDHELLLQTYYQVQVTDFLYAQPVLSYVPQPGASPNYSDAWTFSFRLTALF